MLATDALRSLATDASRSAAAMASGRMRSSASAPRASQNSMSSDVSRAMRDGPAEARLVAQVLERPQQYPRRRHGEARDGGRRIWPPGDLLAAGREPQEHAAVKADAGGVTGRAGGDERLGVQRQDARVGLPPAGGHAIADLRRHPLEVARLAALGPSALQARSSASKTRSTPRSRSAASATIASRSAPEP